MTDASKSFCSEVNFQLKAEEVQGLPGEGSSAAYPPPTLQPVLQPTSWPQQFKPSSPPPVTSILSMSLLGLRNQSHLLLSLLKDQFCVLGCLVSFQIGIDVHEDIIEGGDGNS